MSKIKKYTIYAVVVLLGFQSPELTAQGNS